MPISFPVNDGVRFIKNVMVPISDGIRLGMDMHVPDSEDWERTPRPLILEYIPYRKDDAYPHSGHHQYFAKHGFIGARLDCRGTGSSEGVNTDEYTPREQQDCVEAIEWIARQPWSTGKIAMFGASYGGFTCVQIAAHRPPHLTTIIPMYFTDDRYTDDCHYRGGCFRCYYDIGAYGSSMIGMNAMPPYPEYSGEDWGRLWEEHLEGNTPYILQWLEHQTDGEYWRPGSLRGRYDQIECSVFMIGGWRDGYPNPPLRTYANLSVPRKVLIGPWNHSAPSAAIPGPRIDHLHEIVRWCDYWLKGEQSGVMDEAPIAIYMQTYDEPRADRLETSGYWRVEKEFPIGGTEDRTFYLHHSSLDATPTPTRREAMARGVLERRKTTGRVARWAKVKAYLESISAEKNDLSQWADNLLDQFEKKHELIDREMLRIAGPDEYTYRPTVGVAGGLWSGGVPFGLPTDQRPDETYSVTYTMRTLSDPLEIIGEPQAVLYISSTAPVMAFVARLCDVAPDGTSALVCSGVLNATRRTSLDHPEPLIPDDIYEIVIDLDCTAWRFETGHRIRLSISSADFSNLWPTPYAGTNRVYRDDDHLSRVILPVVPKKLVANEAEFEPSSATVRVYRQSPDECPWEIVQDLLGDRTGLKTRTGGTGLVNPKTEITSRARLEVWASNHDPADVVATGKHSRRIVRNDGVTTVDTICTVRSTETAFHVTIDLVITVNGLQHHERKWVRSFPRVLL